MSLLIKAGIVTLTIGSVSTAGYFGGTYLFGRTPIKDLINKEYQYILLDTTGNNDSSYWDANWKTYQDTNTSKDSDDLGLEGWIKGQKKDLKDKLKLKCKELSGTSVYGNENLTYKHVTKYCARYVNVKDQAKKEGLTIIDDSNAGESWNKREQNKSNLTNHFTNLGIRPSAGGDIKANDIKTGCGSIATKNKSENNYQTIYDSYKEVCVKKSND
ncbi:hypothetical protein A6V39_01355 [Candidatus Mycoplasma haematobovis]|uniref:Uncharacterized protein n=1 Tax=Candidatus Mycoplasma haematobovis TaxID=432608 RepID=A0A1A9QFB1_9MOLU|nr:hypothetical protein [Candidatus Mycoplasma haematobovis]OAL10701.1 hypothetical protein A6V39_01355 [Candidatus Mycoplasma haematobovis]